MEARLLVAYGLIAVVAVLSGIIGFIWTRKRKARKRRLRGIKTYTSVGSRPAAR